MSDSVYILRVSGRLTDEHKRHLRKEVWDQIGKTPLILDGGMQLEIVGQTYYRASDHLPPLGHHVLIWTGDVWDIGYREERGDTWRWLLIEHEGIDYLIGFWAYLPNPPPIEVVVVESPDGTKYSLGTVSTPHQPQKIG